MLTCLLQAAMIESTQPRAHVASTSLSSCVLNPRRICFCLLTWAGCNSTLTTGSTHTLGWWCLLAVRKETGLELLLLLLLHCGRGSRCRTGHRRQQARSKGAYMHEHCTLCSLLPYAAVPEIVV